MMKGSGAVYLLYLLTNRSGCGPGRPQNIQILRMQIRNTAGKFGFENKAVSELNCVIFTPPHIAKFCRGHFYLIIKLRLCYWFRYLHALTKLTVLLKDGTLEDTVQELF
jgi:hypothetical protein